MPGAPTIVTASDHNLHTGLRAFLQGRICIVGVGNRHRGDDGAGPRLIDERRPDSPGVWLDAGVVPENFLEPVATTCPDRVLIVDAVDFRGRAGECRLLNPADADTLTVSTHAGSLATLSSYLAVRTGAQVRVLAIQPGAITPDDELSDPVKSAVERLALLLFDILTSADPASTRS